MDRFSARTFVFPASLVLATMSIIAQSCNKPPTRSFIVKNSRPATADDPSSSENSEAETGDSEADSASTDTSEPESDSTKPSPGMSGSSDNKPPVESKPDSTTKPQTPGMNTGNSSTPDNTPSGPKNETPAKLVECTNKLSVGRIHQWHATNEGQMNPQSGLIVVKEGDKNVAKVEFIGEGWHVLPVWLKNAYEAEVDLSKSKNFTMTYSATADLYVQLRPAFAWSGGDKWAARIPSTGGELKTLTVSFEDAAMWSAPLGQPSHSLNDARAKARGFVFVGNKPTKFAVTSLLIDGYTPPCE